MAALTGNNISATYQSLLKTSGNTLIGATIQQITDGLGNTTPMYLSNTILGTNKLVLKPLDATSADRIVINYGVDGLVDPIGVGIGGPNSLGNYGVEIMGTSNLSTDNYFQTIIGYGAYIQAGGVNGVTLIGRAANHKGNNGNGVAVGRDTSTDSFGVVVGSISQVTGAHNVSVGGRGINIYGTYNVALGSYATIGLSGTTQTQSIAIGPYAAVQGSNSVAIGYGATNSFSNSVVLGSTSQSVVIGANVSPAGRLHVRGTGATSATYSLVLQNSAATNLLRMQDDGGLFLNNYMFGNAFILDLSNGSMTIGSSSSAAASSILDIRSTTKGFLMPRMTQAQILAIATPATGLEVFNTDLAQPCFYDGLGWRKVSHTNM
jgi:hypothetical protein